MMNTNLATACGLFCGNCEHLETKCKSCGTQRGKPFWTVMIKIECCPLYNCSVNTKHLEHCGLCEEFPCETFNQLRDPALNDEEAKNALVERQNDLIKRKEIRTQEWLKQKQKGFSYNSTSFTDSKERPIIPWMSSFSSAFRTSSSFAFVEGWYGTAPQPEAFRVEIL